VGKGGGSLVAKRQGSGQAECRQESGVQRDGIRGTQVRTPFWFITEMRFLDNFIGAAA
jgi:hypothetical protein